MADNKVTKMWDDCLAIIKDNLPAEQFSVWFTPIIAESLEGCRLTLRVPSQFYVEQLEERYLNLLSATLKRVFGPQVQLQYKFNVVATNDETAVTLEHDGASARLKSELKRQPAQPSNPFVHEEYDDIDPQLNLHYTFDNYCDSPCNKLAVTIGKAIADHPEVKTYNPLFVFGSTGVGKTHLLQAIGIRMKEQNPRARVLYLTARVFENQYSTAVRQNKVPDFINFYQSIDVLLLDDIQDFAGKVGTQNTFFHIFNHLHQHQRQLVMSSDCRPSDMDGMIPRLISRFKWGMTVELEKPDYDLRMSVLRMRAAQDGLTISPEVLDFIASHVTDSIRELEGIVVSLLAHATMLNRDITIDLARTVIGNAVKINKRQVTFEIIAETVAAHYNLDTDDLYGKSRKREISDARQLLMFLAKRDAQLSSTNIGLRLARNHATVLHACKQIEQRLTIEKELQADLATKEKALKEA